MQSNGTNSLRKLRRDFWKTRLCSSCVSPLGRIISRGGNCPQCQLRVCKDCRKEIQPGTGIWVCVLCSNGEGISPDIFGKTKSLGRDSRSIRRSWTISTPNRAQTNSPILKSYTIIQPEESLGVGTSTTFNTTGSVIGGQQQNPNNGSNSHRQFHSLPRMTSGSERSKKAKRSFNQDFEKENIKRHRSFQSTLHPYQVPTPPSPTASINFIEDPFWDYYDYDIDDTLSASPRSPRNHNQLRNPRFRSLTGSASVLQRRNSIKQKLESDMDRLLKLNLRSSHSNRSSCERSLGETFDYDYSKNLNYSFSAYTSLSDTELNDNSKYEQEEYSSLSHPYNESFCSPSKRFSTKESSNFYKFATVTPLNMSPMSDSRKSGSNMRPTNIKNNFPTTTTPVKPERKCNRNKRSFSLNSYDGKKLFSPLKTYVVVMNENVVPRTNNIDASIANVNANGISDVDVNGGAGIKGKNNSQAVNTSNNMKMKNPLGFANNTSTILLNSSGTGTSQSKQEEIYANSSTKFHSLPRERVIRIEREDWKFARPTSNEKLAQPTSTGIDRKRNVSKVEITRSVSASAKDFGTDGNLSKLQIDKSGRKIARSQSHREISSVVKGPPSSYEQGHQRNGRDENSTYLNVQNPRSRSNPSPSHSGRSSSNTLRNESANLSLIRGKGDGKGVSATLTPKPLLNLSSLFLDDKENAAVMENFLRSPSQNQNSSSTHSYKTSRNFANGDTNEKGSASQSDFVQERMSDFENFQRQQIQSFDNLRECSTFPRALLKQKQMKHSQDPKSQQESGINNTSPANGIDFESQPKSRDRVRHTSTTQITHDDNFAKSWDDDDTLDEYYFHPIKESRSRPRARSEVQLNAVNYDYPSSVGPIVSLKQSDSTAWNGDPTPGNGPTPVGWSATLPHPYVRKHKQQKSSFIQQQSPPKTDDTFSKEKTRISHIEQEIERDIYFQKTKSLDRVRPLTKSKPSIFDTKFERDQTNSVSNADIPPPVASPRLKRKAKLLESISGTNISPSFNSGGGDPKINAEQQVVNGTGTSGVKNKHKSRLPNEPKPCRDLNSSNPNNLAASRPQSSPSNANKFILQSQSQFANTNSLTNSNCKQPGTKLPFASDSQSGEQTSKMKIVTNYQKSTTTTNLDEIPVATPRSRRKNSNPNNHRSDSILLDETVNVSQTDFHKFNHSTTHERTMDGDTLNRINSSNGKLPQSSQSSSNNNILPKAVRFEAHVIEMENERKHNKFGNNSNTRTNTNANIAPINSSINGGMRMNNNFNNKLQTHLGTFDVGDDCDTTKSSQFDSDYRGINNRSGSISTKSVAYPYNYYNAGKSVYSFRTSPPPSGDKLKSIKKPNNGGFMSRAIAKVKSKAKFKKVKNNVPNSGSGSVSGGLVTKLRSIETRDCITYISPSPSEQGQNQYAPNQASVIKEITLNPIALSRNNDEYQSLSSNVANNNPAISRSESFTKAGILKNSEILSASNNSPKTRPNLNKSPPKPKRSSLKKKSGNMDCLQDDDKPISPIPILPSLTTDQLTPSSTSSSSSSSYLSNLAESYDFFHASEECESIEDDEEFQEFQPDIGGNTNIFKSFEDDEDAGEDFIFYSQSEDSDFGKVKGKSPKPSMSTSTSSINQNHNQFLMNNPKQGNYREILPTKSAPQDKSPTSVSYKKGSEVVLKNNGVDAKPHHHQSVITSTLSKYADSEPTDYGKGVDSKETSTTTPSRNMIRLTDPPPSLPPATTPESESEKNAAPQRSREERDALLAELYKTSHLLLPPFSKSATLPGRRSGFSESQFFPGAQQSEGMSTHQTSTLPKFRSSVIVNNPEGGRAASPEIPAIPRHQGRRNPTKNVTTVEISGDVGIVNSQAASAFLNHRRAQLKKVNNESLWKNSDVYSSGLSRLRGEQLLDVDHGDLEDGQIHSPYMAGNSAVAVAPPTVVDHEIQIEDSHNRNNNGSSGSDSNSTQRKSVSSSVSDDGSDWHSESTKNTVIFRGCADIGGGVTTVSSNSSESLHLSPASTSSTGGVFNYACDPEIHISNIDLADNYVNEESGVTDETSRNCVKSTTADSAKLTPLSNANSNKAVDDKRIITDKDISRTGKNVESLGISLINGVECDTLTAKGRQQGVSISEPRLVKEFSAKSSNNKEALITELDDQLPQSQGAETLHQIPKDEMVQRNLKNDDPTLSKLPRPVSTTTKDNKIVQPRRESPEGQEQEVPVTHPDKEENVKPKQSAKPKKKALRVGEVIIMENPKGSTSGKVLSKSEISHNALSRITTSRSSPDGADADRSEADSTTTTEPEGDSPTPMMEHFDVTSDEDSWVEEIIFEDDDTAEPSIQMCRKAQPQPPPLDLTLHTIVEESCEESEPESGHFDPSQKLGSKQRRTMACSSQQQQQNDNELEKYFNFGINTGDNGFTGGRQSFSNEDSEFSDDTFSESSFSMQDDHDEGGANNNNERRAQRGGASAMDPAELASSRLEKYFYNLGLPQSMINPISSINHQTGESEDSVGSESESDNSVLEKRKKVLKHHRRSADFEDELDQVSDEEEDFGFGQDGFDTIKKTTNRKGSKKSDTNPVVETASSAGFSKTENNLQSSTSIPSRPNIGTVDLNRMTKSPLEKTSSNGTSSNSTSSTSPTSPSNSKKSFPPGESGTRDRPLVKVNRSNSFQWSSDEEVNIMMSKLRQLIRNLVKAKTEQTPKGQSGTSSSSTSQPTGDKDKQLAYLEGELIRLMKTENLKNIVEYFSSEESDVDDVYKFIKVVKESSSNGEENSDFGEIDLEDPNLLQSLQTTMSSDSANLSPKGSPALLAKVMGHIGNRLAVWMKDENMEDNNDDTVTLKCAQSISSDLNEDRFSWKGSFESALAAKRQSVGSTDSISSSDFTQDRSILRSSSLHHLANSAHHLGQVSEEHKEEEDSASSLPRMTNLCNSLPRLNQPSNLSISRAQSLVISAEEEDSPVTTPTTGPIKSARYRPPGFQPVKSKRIDDEGKNSSILSQSTPMLTHPDGLKTRSDSVGSIFHDATKPHIPVKGQVEFLLQYNYKHALLEVRVKQCRELAAVDSKRNRSDPYVKAYLLPDRSKNGKRKTKVKKNTLNPVFEEVLKFPLTLSDLQNRTLWLSVWHSDIFGKNEFLGEVLVELKDRVFDDVSSTSWDLQEMSGQTEDMPRGDVVLALKWQPKTETTGNLSVLVKEAKNLAPVKNGGSPSSFVKCSLLSDSRKQKTSVCRRNNHPVWNQTLSFEDAGIDGLEITLWNHDLLSNNDLLGTVRIEYDNPLWGSMLSRRLWVEGILRLT